jgi:hypothetical protein
MTTSILLLHPPVAKPGEPPAGVARLAGALQQHGIPCTVVDLNLECLLSLMNEPLTPADRWTHRALRNLPKNLDHIRNLETYRNFDRYHRSVTDLNRVFEKSSPSPQVHLSLANYQHGELSPVRSTDLLRAAETPEENPFFPYFQQRLIELIALQNPSIAGLSLNFLSQALCTFAVLGLLRREFPDLTLVLGGGLVTSWLRRPGWKTPFGGLVDHLVAGAGEPALLAIAGAGTSAKEPCVPNYDFVLNTRQTLAGPGKQPNPPPPPFLKGGNEDCPFQHSALSTQHSAPSTQHSARPPSLIALIKPQFEAGRTQVGKGGVVRNESVHQAVCDSVREFCRASGFEVHGIIRSPILGPKGNVEFLLFATFEGSHAVT